MKIMNLAELDSKSGYHLVVGDCATNHLSKFLKLGGDVFSRQIQGGLGCEGEFKFLNGSDTIFLFVSWANAISVIEDKEQANQRIESHINVLSQLEHYGKPILMIDRHGFLDRYCSADFLKGREMIPYPEALREGWRPQSLTEQMNRRLNYRQLISKFIGSNIHYFDLFEYLGVTTYRHESGECKNNLVNVAPWHYDIPSYQYAANVYNEFVCGKEYECLIKNWELGVLNIKSKATA